MPSIKSRALQNDPLLAVCYLISFLALFLAAATALNIDENVPIIIFYVDLVVGIGSLGMAQWIERSAAMLPRRLFAGFIALACLVVLAAQRDEPSSTLIISIVPILVLILAEQSLWPIWLDPLVLIVTAVLSKLSNLSAAFIGFHVFIFLTIGGVSVSARRNVERALEAERRAEQETQRAENEGRIKKMFGSISHELNNATTGMAALMPLLIEQGEHDSLLQRSLHAIQWNILDIQRIANQLRLLAKTGDITLTKTVFPLKPLIETLVAEAESWVAQRDRAISIAVTCDPTLHIYANEFWLGLYPVSYTHLTLPTNREV